VSVLDEDVQRLFVAMFQARRAIAKRQEDLRAAEAAVTTARSDLDAAQAALADAEKRIQELAERVAGVSSRVDESETVRVHPEFRPIRR